MQGAPTAAFLALAPVDAAAAGPAMLVFLLAPATGGFVFSRGLVRPPARAWGRPALLATLLAASLVGIGLLTGLVGGAVAPGDRFDLAGGAAGAATGVVTSTLEELGWAAGGLAIARAAFGRQLGVFVLGALWAPWHLVVARFAPADQVLAMFGATAPLEEGRILAFVVGCVAYRALLTRLQDRADAIWPAVAGHVAGNVLAGGLFGSGLLRLVPDGPWAFFPGPTGLPFLIGTLAAVVWLDRRAPRAA